jgi:hypothetical protein
VKKHHHGGHRPERRTLNLLGSRVLLFVSVSSVVALLAATDSRAQIRYAAGQNVVPVFEGWERNADGSFNMVFGYMNRNYEEQVDIPVSPNNAIDPFDFAQGGPGGDLGQPTHFYPRRQQFVFKVKVPKDWGKKDLVWTLTSRGKTEKAYGTLLPFWEIDAGTYQQNRGGPGELGEEDDAPTAKLEGTTQRTIGVDSPLTLDAYVIDDGKPSNRPSQSGSNPRVEGPLSQAVVKLDRGMRLGMVWVVYRGDARAVTFNPAKAAVGEGGKTSTTVRFSAPGTYVLRGYADDGILFDVVDVTVTVRPIP